MTMCNCNQGRLACTCKRLQPSTAPMWGQGSCARPANRDELRNDSPSGLVPVKVSLRWHVRAVLVVVMTVSAAVWFLS